ncbi:putative membrane protein [Collimonas pratensis]|uniref:Putative membrane protein n=1 Tax=Collimonas pratensis TaxID=279113 RepID=A0A127Q5P7_9BURK|nr:putative membrane protein [Collimonas pratensis]
MSLFKKSIYQVFIFWLITSLLLLMISSKTALFPATLSEVA